MNSDSYIFDTVRQKVKIFSFKFTTEYFLAEHKRKQFIASSFQAINFRTLTMKFRRLAEAYFVIAVTFRRRTESAIRRTVSAIRRTEPARGRTESAIRRTESATRRTESATWRTEPARWRTESAIWRTDLTNLRTIPAIQFIEVKPGDTIPSRDGISKNYSISLT